MKKFSIYYNNARGVKSKIESIIKIVKEKEPTVIALAETLMATKNEIEIEGYTIMDHTPWNTHNRGTLIAVCNEIKGIVKLVGTNH